MKAQFDAFIRRAASAPEDEWRAGMHVATTAFIIPGFAAFGILEAFLRGPGDPRTLVAFLQLSAMVLSLIWTWQWKRWRGPNLLVVLGLITYLSCMAVLSPNGGEALAVAWTVLIVLIIVVHGYRSALPALAIALAAGTFDTSLLSPPFDADALEVFFAAALSMSVLAGSVWAVERARERAQALAVRRARTAEHAAREAEELAFAKERFLATVSHELRTPLNGVVNIAQLLDDTKMDAEQRDLVQSLRASGRALFAVINDVLDFSKLQSAPVLVERAAFELRLTVEDIASTLRPIADERGVVLDFDVGNDVPRWVVGDENRIRQVLTNLISNAIKFSPFGQVTLEVGHGEVPEHLRFTVRDTGIGIPNHLLEEIFDPFKQADASTTRRFGGTGLGLAISRRLCEAMGGSISCQSVEGAGSTFIVNLPLPAGSAPARREHEAQRDLAGLRVLVAEDNAVNRMVIGGLLGRLSAQAHLWSRTASLRWPTSARTRWTWC